MPYQRDVLTVEEDGPDNYSDEGGDYDEDSYQPRAKFDRGSTVMFEGNTANKKKIFERKKKLMRVRKRLTAKEQSEKNRLRQEKVIMGLVKPDVTTNREHERLLRHVATKGVVQLFNAVAERQKAIDEELSKKMTLKERKMAKERLSGSKFNLYGDQADLKKEKEEEDDDMETSQLKLETDENSD